MTNKCDKCCNLYDSVDENDNQYIIDRLEDIVHICNYLIKVLEHKKVKENILDEIVNEEKESMEIDPDNQLDVDEFIDFLKSLSVNKSYPDKQHVYKGPMPKMRYPYYGIWF